METKEAVEFCDEIDDLINAVENLSDNSRSEIYRDLISLKKLLKRGEKFEAMWKEFKETFGNGTMENDFGGRLGPINDIMDNYRQKYFPKEEADNKTEIS